ncbi:hypothetical protein IWX90DRAFT_209957 [Phyllosticta citrichinensis]|uniref:Uncharacterized protein n=1 Tax=Phyllosticta citrichinensis TaxID=1130410 RepID=A0ABR1XSW4_9PEZI
MSLRVGDFKDGRLRACDCCDDFAAEKRLCQHGKASDRDSRFFGGIAKKMGQRWCIRVQFLSTPRLTVALLYMFLQALASATLFIFPISKFRNYLRLPTTLSRPVFNLPVARQQTASSHGLLLSSGVLLIHSHQHDRQGEVDSWDLSSIHPTAASPYPSVHLMLLLRPERKSARQVSRVCNSAPWRVDGRASTGYGRPWRGVF